MVEMHEIYQKIEMDKIIRDCLSLCLRAPKNQFELLLLLLHGQFMVIFAILIDLKTEGLLF